MVVIMDFHLRQLGIEDLLVRLNLYRMLKKHKNRQLDHLTISKNILGTVLRDQKPKIQRK